MKNINVIKVINRTHVGYTYVFKPDSTSVSFVAKITADNGVYSEEFVLANIKEWIGFKATFKYELYDDKWHYKGSNTFKNVTTEFDEVWQKLKFP